MKFVLLIDRLHTRCLIGMLLMLSLLERWCLNEIHRADYNAAKKISQRCMDAAGSIGAGLWSSKQTEAQLFAQSLTRCRREKRWLYLQR